MDPEIRVRIRMLMELLADGDPRAREILEQADDMQSACDLLDEYLSSKH